MVGWPLLFPRGRLSRVPGLTDLPHFLLTSSGRAALWLALRELGIGPGDRVLVPTYHCPTMMSPVAAAGAEPVFFAIGEDGLPLLGQLAATDLARVRALLAVHYFGIARPLAEVRAFCDRHGIALIEDCAHAFFGGSEGRSVGSWGDLAIGSLAKFFAVPEGGCLASKVRPLHTQLAPPPRRLSLRHMAGAVEFAARFGGLPPLGVGLRAALRLRDRLRGRVDPLAPSIEPAAGLQRPVFDEGSARRQPSAAVCAIVARTDRERLRERRQRNYLRLAQRLDGVSGLRVITPAPEPDAVPYVFPLWVNSPERSYYPLRLAGVPVFRWDIQWPGVPELPGDVGVAWSTHVFQLACHQDLGDADMDAIADTVIRLASA